MNLIATLPNTGNSDKLLAFIDPINESVKTFGFDWTDDVVGTTGLTKWPFGWVVACQCADSTNGLAFMNHYFEFESYLPLKKIKDAHSITHLNQHLYVVSTGDNSVYKCYLHPFNKIEEEVFYCFDEEKKDKLHLNSIALHHSGIIVKNETFILSMFGECGEDELWSEGNHNGKIVSLVSRGAGIERYTIKDNLFQPHTAKIVEAWWESYCESASGTFTVMDNSIGLGGYIRGMTYDSENFYVGVSESRNVSRSTGEEVEELHPDKKAAICVIDRRSFELKKRFGVNEWIKEIYDISLFEGGS